MKSTPSNSAARNSAPAPSASTASVPISVYRELAAELQATRAMVDSLNGKNQQLNQENQILRQEMQRVVYSVLSLQPWIEAIPEDQHLAFSQSHPKAAHGQGTAFSARPTWEETAAATAIAAKLRSPDPQSGEWITEEPATPQRITQTKPARSLGGLWLTLTVVTIIITAFGAGFLIMRPFLPTAK
jgi:hypothetical protein